MAPPCFFGGHSLKFQLVRKGAGRSLEEQQEAVFGDAVESSQMTFGLVPEVLNPIDVVLPVGKAFRVVNADMVEIRDIQGIVARESVRVDDAVREDHPLHDREQGGGAGVGDHDRKDPASSLQQPENRDFARCSTATFSFPGSTEVALIDLDFASKGRGLLHFIGNDFAQAGEECRCGVAMDADDLSRRPGRCPGNKVFNEPCPFLGAEPALSCIHGTTLA